MTRAAANQPTTDARAADPGAGDASLAGLVGELIALAHQCSACSAFYRLGFRRIAEWLHAPYASLSVRHVGAVIEDYWHTGPTDPNFWKPPVDGLLTSVMAAGKAQMRLFRATRGEARVSLLSAPLMDQSGGLVGAISLCAPYSDDQSAHRRLLALTSLASLLSYLANASVRVRQEARERSPLSGLVANASIHDARSAQQLAFTITNDLRTRLGCEQVALAIIEGRRTRIVSISGLDHVSHRSPGVRLIQAAMDECHDHKAPIVCDQAPWTSGDPRPDHRLHRQWAGGVGGGAVASIPFRLSDTHAVVVSLRARKSGAFSAEVIEDLQETLAPAVAAIPLVHASRRTLVAHARESITESARAALRPEGWRRRAAIGAGIALTTWFLFGTLPHRVSATCNVIPATLQHVVAPFDGVVKAAYVAEGDTVVAGQLLYELDAASLVLERDRLQAELAVAGIEIDRALAAQDPGEAGLAAARRRVLETRLRLLDDRLARTEARAAFDGAVISGDPRTLVGQSVAMGDPLYVITPSRDWIVELETPESAIDELDLGQSAVFTCDARPEARHEGEVARLLPRAQLRDGRNVFIAEVRVEEPPDWVRPGMQGVTRVDVGRRPVWWLATHRVVDFARRKLWL